MGQMYSERPVAGFGGEGGEQNQRKCTHSGVEASRHDANQGLLTRSQGLLTRSQGLLTRSQGLLTRSGDTGVS
jgi:hypothetical protein